MSTARLPLLIRGLRNLRRAPDLDALLAPRSPRELAALALIPRAATWASPSVCCPRPCADEATAALLACRVLDAFEDLSDRAVASGAVLAAVDYLNGASDTLPAPLPALEGKIRDSEAVDRVLAERIADVRALLAALSEQGREGVGLVLTDVGRVMARNIDAPLTRVAYSEGVLGRITHYACALVAEDVLPEADLRELTGCVAVIAQSANDLRDNELAIYGAADREELTRMVMLRQLTPALGGFALLAKLGPGTPSLGARAAMAYMVDHDLGVPVRCGRRARALPARGRRGHAGRRLVGVLATMLERVRRSGDAAIHQMLDASPDFTTGSASASQVLGAGDLASTETSLMPLIVDTTFALVHTLPEGRLTGELSDSAIRTMMIADHLAFGAMERVPATNPTRSGRATRLQLAALDNSSHRSRGTPPMIVTTAKELS